MDREHQLRKLLERTRENTPSHLQHLTKPVANSKELRHLIFHERYNLITDDKSANMNRNENENCNDKGGRGTSE